MAEGTHLEPARTRMLRLSDPETRMAGVRTAFEELELSPHTIRLYMQQLTHAERWATEEDLTLPMIGAEDFKRYVGTRPRTVWTRRAMYSAFGHYWRFVGRRNPPQWAIRVPRKSKMVWRGVEDPEAARIATRALTVGGKRGAATVLALFNGLRREEIATVRRDKVDDEGWIEFIGKGNKVCTMPLHPFCRVALDSLPDEGSPYYFPGRVDGHVNPTTVWTWVIAVTDGKSPHVLRHTAIAKGNDETKDLRAAQDFARHERPETTAGYTRTTRQRLLGVLAAIDYGLAS